MTAATLQRLLGSRAATAALALVLALGVAAAVRVVGPLGLLLPLLVGGMLVGLERPGVLVATLLTSVVLIEDSDSWRWDVGKDLLYGTAVSTISVAELLIGLTAVAVVLDLARRRAAVHLRPFSLPLVLVLTACVVGAVVGATNGGPELLPQLRGVLVLVVVPVLVVAVVRDAVSLRTALALLGGLAAAKAVLGVVASFGGGTVEEEGVRLTYLDPASNFVLVGFLLWVLGAFAMRLPLRPWMLGAAPLALLTLALSLRRSFYLAFAVGAIVVLVLAIGASGRRVVLPLAGVAAVAVWLSLGSGLGAELRTTGAEPVVDRIEALDPARVQANPQDRYRLAERRNVLSTIADQPLTGVGFGVPWTLRTGLPAENAGTRQYAHIALLWWWLRTGVVGAAAYLALLAGAIAAGVRVGRRHPDPVVRAAGHAAVALTIGYAVVEATATFTGVELRMTIVLGTFFGLLAAAAAQASARPAPHATLAA